MNLNLTQHLAVVCGGSRYHVTDIFLIHNNDQFLFSPLPLFHFSILFHSVDCACLHFFNPFNGVSVTALAFGPPLGPLGTTLCKWMLACGAESGDINYWDLGPADSTLIYTVKSSHCHGSTVKKLAWAPDSINRPFSLTKEIATESWNIDLNSPDVHVGTGINNSISDSRRTACSDGQTDTLGTVDPLIPSWKIASCGEDHTVRIFRIEQSN